MQSVRSAIGTLRWWFKRWLHPVRTEILKRHIQPGAVLHVYWKKEALGEGPCASLYIGHHEAIRFDCFGPTGHYHVHVQEQERRGPASRIGFGTDSIQEQINRSHAQILRIREHLSTSEVGHVHDFVFEGSELAFAADWMREKMKEKFQTRP